MPTDKNLQILRVFEADGVRCDDLQERAPGAEPFLCPLALRGDSSRVQGLASLEKSTTHGEQLHVLAGALHGSAMKRSVFGCLLSVSESPP